MVRVSCRGLYFVIAGGHGWSQAVDTVDLLSLSHFLIHTPGQNFATLAILSLVYT